MITDLINKIFMILMGVVIILILYSLVDSINSTSCYPRELYQEEGLAGLGGGIFDNVYDSMCSTIANINNGLFEVFLNPWAELPGIRSMILSMSNGVWGMGKFFCKTHTNFDYTDLEGSEAITDPEHLLEVFLYESERCWNIFEGVNLNGSNNKERNPISNLGFFHCAEIIYDFPAGVSLSFDRINERINQKNTCGAETNIPKSFPDNTYYWCLPKELMSDFWYNRNRDLMIYNASTNSCSDLTDLTTYPRAVTSSYCLKNDVATCSLAGSYAANSVSGYTVIDGAGKIVISYFDGFNWKRYDSASKLKSYDNYLPCDNVDAFNNFEDMEYYIPAISGQETIYNNKNLLLNDVTLNSLVICYEKYDTPSYSCKGTLNCAPLKFKSILDSDYQFSDCRYAIGCQRKNSYSADCVNASINPCSSFATEEKCKSNEAAGCYWEARGACAGTLNCGLLPISTRETFSCSKSSLCEENFWGNACEQIDANKGCSSLISEYQCNKESHAGCSWVSNI